MLTSAANEEQSSVLERVQAWKWLLVTERMKWLKKIESRVAPEVVDIQSTNVKETTEVRKAF